MKIQYPATFLLLAAFAVSSSAVEADPPSQRDTTSQAADEDERNLLEKIPSLLSKVTERFLQASGVAGEEEGGSDGGPAAAAPNVCTDPGFDTTIDPNLRKIMMTTVNYRGLMEGLAQIEDTGLSIGSTTALIPEANDAGADGAEGLVTVADGKSGDTRFPHGDIKPIATVGERSVCPRSYGEKIVGVPDGLGAYLPDDGTVRVVVQSEGYGPIKYESYAYKVNGGKASIAGSHVQYVDYDRGMFANFMESSLPASRMVTGMGEMVERMYNLKGEEVGRRNGTGETTVGAHYSNTDANGTYVAKKVPAEADWLLMSLCSAHLEQKHQWGEGIGLEDDVFITNEEWMHYEVGKHIVGISAQVLDIHAKSLYAAGVFTNGGFEKIVELNPTNENYVILAVSGYNGPFDDDELIEGEVFIPEETLKARNSEYSKPDGSNFTWTRDIVPFRIYVGVKGKLEDGSAAPDDDFLARNGLKHGQMYGFAVDMRNGTDATGPTGGEWRDPWHKVARNGQAVPGKWIAQPWKWDGKVRNYEHDGSWDYQLPPPLTGPGEDLEGYFWWNAAGADKKGCKTEHVTPDPREGRTAFISGSTCGYFGHLYINGVAETLASAGDSGLPEVFDGTYYVYQGETNVTGQIELGGQGRLAGGRNATLNWDEDGMESGEGKPTFEDIDGLEVFQDGDRLYAMIQEDSGNLLGDRMFITSPLEHDDDGVDMTYYFVAMSGGKENTRALAGAGVPSGSLCHDGEKYVTDSHEFSGLFDLSGLLRRDEDTGGFALSASDGGMAKRQNDAAVSINDKYILIGLQAHSHTCGVIEAFQADRGGQWLVYQPSIPTAPAPDS